MEFMEKLTVFGLGVMTCALVSIAGIVFISENDARTCEAWAEADGLTGQAVVVVCQTGENAVGDMTEAEYRERMNASLTEVKTIIDETGGL